MSMATWFWAMALPLAALDESSLNGVYHYRYLQVTQAEVGGSIGVTQSLGTLLFDGQGRLAEGSRRRGYLVDERGFVLLPAPGSQYALDGRVSPDTAVIAGSGTENSGRHDLFVAVRTSVAPTAPRGVYHVAVLLLPSDRADAAVSTQASFDISEAQLQMSGDGTGNLTLPLSTNLPTRSYNIAVSGDGSVLIGSPRSGRGLLVGVSASEVAPAGTYWTMAMALEGGRVSTSMGSLRVEGTRRIRFSQRWNSGGRAYDYVGVRPIGSPGVGRGTLVSASTAAEEPALTFAVRVPSFSGTGLFVDPHEVRHAASDGPVGAPLSPGSLATIGGRGLAASRATATGLPLPTVMQGTRVDVDASPAGLHSVEEGLIRFVVPAGLRPGLGRIVVRNATAESAAVRARIAAASPGIFTDLDSGAAVATHADFSRVTTESPAREGEIVVLFATGVGTQRPAVRVWFGGRPAEVLYSGPAGLPGLDQVNVRIPAGLASSVPVPVTISDGESFSDTATIAISQ